MITSKDFYVHADDDAVEVNIYCKAKYKDEILSALKLKKLLEIGLQDSTLFADAVSEKFKDTAYVPLQGINKALTTLLKESKKIDL